MMNDLTRYGENTFERIKHLTAEGVEFWYARELQAVLEYTEWRNFELVILKSKEACSTSGNSVADHFVDVNKTIPMPKINYRHYLHYWQPSGVCAGLYSLRLVFV